MRLTDLHLRTTGTALAVVPSCFIIHGQFVICRVFMMFSVVATTGTLPTSTANVYSDHYRFTSMSRRGPPLEGLGADGAVPGRAAVALVREQVHEPALRPFCDRGAAIAITPTTTGVVRLLDPPHIFYLGDGRKPSGPSPSSWGAAGRCG